MQATRLRERHGHDPPYVAPGQRGYRRWCTARKVQPVATIIQHRRGVAALSLAVGRPFHLDQIAAGDALMKRRNVRHSQLFGSSEQQRRRRSGLACHFETFRGRPDGDGTRLKQAVHPGSVQHASTPGVSPRPRRDPSARPPQRVGHWSPGAVGAGSGPASCKHEGVRCQAYRVRPGHAGSLSATQ